MDYYFVYVKTDEEGRIIAVNSSAFLTDTNGWTEIDCGTGDRYHHAQGNYLDKPICTDDGIYQYKLVDGVAVERTVEEIAADLSESPTPVQSDSERIAALEEEFSAAKILWGWRK